MDRLIALRDHIHAFGLRRVKISSLLLVLLLVILLTVLIFLFFFLQGRSPGVILLPDFHPNLPEYAYSFFGQGDKLLSKPMDLALSGNRVYVTDTMNQCVKVFAHNGDYLFEFGSRGPEEGQFEYPYGLAVSDQGEIFVADSHTGKISVFNDQGSFLRYFGHEAEALTQPAEMLFHRGKLYVANLDPASVLVFDAASGEHLSTIGRPGSGEGELSYPNALTLGEDGNLYVSDTGNNRIQVFSTDGNYLKVFTDDIDNPRGLAFDSFGRLLVASKLMNEIVVLDRHGNVVDRLGSNHLNLPNGLALDGKGGVFVTDLISVVVFK